MQSVFIDLDRVLEDMKLYEMQSDRKSIESITLYVQFALPHLVRPSPVGGFVFDRLQRSDALGIDPPLLCLCQNW